MNLHLYNDYADNSLSCTTDPSVVRVEISSSIAGNRSFAFASPSTALADVRAAITGRKFVCLYRPVIIVTIRSRKSPCSRFRFFSRSAE